MMSYKVEVEREEHELLLGGVIEGWSRQEHDVHLVSNEGHKVFSHKVILSLYSNVLREILYDPMMALSSNTATIFLPASVSTISSLIKILVQGKLNSNETNGIVSEEIKDVARAVGIDLTNCSEDEGWRTTSYGSGLTVQKLPLKKAQQVPKPFKIVPKSLKVRPVIKKSMNRKFEKEFINEDTTKTESDTEPKATKTKRGGNRTSKYLTASGKFACDICMKEFRKAKGLYKHRRMVHAIRRRLAQPPVETIIKEEKLVPDDHEHHKYECDICQKLYKNSAMLRKHKVTHLPDSEKPFSCEICGKRFCQSQNKKIHKEKHHGNNEKPCNKIEENLSSNMEMKTENGSDEFETSEMPTDEEIGIENVVNNLDSFVNEVEGDTLN